MIRTRRRFGSPVVDASRDMLEAVHEPEYLPNRCLSRDLTPSAEPVELRIHGVSGTPPEAMLDAHFVTRSVVNATTGFYASQSRAGRCPVPAWMIARYCSRVTRGAA